VDAAARLLEAGEEPSVAEIAKEADVSRRTVYLHFPTLEQLLIDATAGMLAASGYGDALDLDAYGDDVHARVEGLARALLRMSDEALPLGRRLIRLTVDSPEGELPQGTPRRGYRRVEWIERAVEPLREHLTDEQFERLVSGLSLVLGWEAMIVLRDLRGLERAQEEDATMWASRALVDAMVAEAEAQAGTDAQAARARAASRRRA
jgi:AcrR family transcriptional regulator